MSGLFFPSDIDSSHQEAVQVLATARSNCAHTMNLERVRAGLEFSAIRRLERAMDEAVAELELFSLPERHFFFPSLSTLRRVVQGTNKTFVSLKGRLLPAVPDAGRPR